MERTEVSKYLNKFSVELKNFLIVLDELMPTETVQKILEQYDVYDGMKLLNKYRNCMVRHKERLTSHDDTLFSKSLYVIPEVDISFYWNNLPENHRKTIIDYLMRLLICSNIVIEKLHPTRTKVPEKQEVKKANVKKQEVKKTEIQKPRNLFDGVGENNNNISVESFANETADAQLDGNPLMNKLMENLNVDQLTEQLSKIDDNAMNKITEGISQFMGPHIQDQGVKTLFQTMPKDIIEKLKTCDIKKDGLWGVVKKMSTEMADDMTSNKNTAQCDPEKLMESAQAMMSNLGLGDNINIGDLNPASMMSMASKLMSTLTNSDSQTPQPPVNNTVAMMDLFGKLAGI